MIQLSNRIYMLFNALLMFLVSFSQDHSNKYQENHRPQVHFSPLKNWMNDPNGLVYFKGTYHLFFQYYPDKPIWGPMHWGHATSADMIHWKEQPIALYPDSIGYIFSGSAAVDFKNSSGLGKQGQPPLVAIFTQHDPKTEETSRVFQNQSIAYSTDSGNTWFKYSGNPVLRNPGIRDFRDPKVIWFEKGNKWIMTLATQDHISFYSSPNLKDWTKESEFGKDIGAHGGVWECPDLFPLKINNKTSWVLLVSINPGGPNGGSATQYFLGDFDGKSFNPVDSITRWVDFGPDNYAGVTWSNTGDRRIFIGWMSNWSYANQVPTEGWRSAMTIPRELVLREIDSTPVLLSFPIQEIKNLYAKKLEYADLDLSKQFLLKGGKDGFSLPCLINIDTKETGNFELQLSNDKGERLLIGYDKIRNHFFIDRTRSGQTGFSDRFAGVHTGPRLSANPKIQLALVIDVSSIELFADGGLTVMTEIFFPNSPYTDFEIHSSQKLMLKRLEFISLNRIW